MTAATNVLILWNTNGSAPSGWTDTGVDHTGRFILIGATVGAHGGATTHTHTYNSVASGNYTTSTHNAAGTTAYYDTVQTHNHSMTSTTVSDENSMPPYKDYGLYYRALAGWDGKVPAGTVAMIGTCPTNWTKVDDGSSYFIRVVADADTKGGTGGTASHTHTLAGTLSALTATSQLWNITSSYAVAKNHGHTYSGSSSSQSNSTGLYYLGAGLVKADVETHVTQNMYLWFDGDVPATFDQVTDQGYVKQSATNTYANGGSDSVIAHTHDSFNITSGGMSSSANTQEYSLGSYWHVKAHTHAVTGSLNSGNVSPLYVGLTMGKAKATFYSTVNPTYTMDTKFFGTANHPYTVDRRLKGTAQVTYSVDRRLKGTVNLTASLDALVQRAFTSTCGMDTHVVAYYAEVIHDPDVLVQKAFESAETSDLLLQRFDIDKTYSVGTPLLKTVDNDDAKLDVCVTNTFPVTYDLDYLVKKVQTSSYTGNLFAKGSGSEIYDIDTVIVYCKHTGYGGRCNVLLQDIESSYGMAVEISTHPRHYEVKRPVPYVFVPETLPENINTDSITMANIPGAKEIALVYPETTTPTEENPITPTQYEETRGNEPNKKQPFTEQVVESEKV